MIFRCEFRSYKSECEEMAESLLPKYLEGHNAHSRHGIARWVSNQMKHESKTVIDNVTHHLQELVFQRYK